MNARRGGYPCGPSYGVPGVVVGLPFADLDDHPVLIVAGPEALEDNLAGANTTRNDLRARPRESNVARSEQVLAVIFKTTGYVTVIHGEGPLDPDLFEGARGAERLRPRT